APLVAEADRRCVALDPLDRDGLGLEQERGSELEPRGDQVLHDLLLPVDRDPVAAGQLVERDAVAAALEAELDAVVDETLAPEAVADAHLDEQLDRPLLEHAGAHARLDVGAVARLENDGLDALALQQVAEHEPRGAG